ncbi:MAG: diaminopimelate epimerase [Oscillospiraceae bacterium]|nr:diaminopimelate epimerase [Oscillospiraceae bacterium]
MRFTKMQGAGNDFIIINNMEEGLPERALSGLAARLCTRRLSIGADGLMVVERPEGDADYRMLFFNSDGSRGEMCGNGARCIARYGHDRGLAGARQRIETDSGVVEGERLSARLYRVRLNSPSHMETEHPIEIDCAVYDCAYVELGSPGLPHCVALLDGFISRPEDELRDLGRRMRNHPDFPKGANVTFCSHRGEKLWQALTFERGVEDFTLACGTGAGSAAAALTLRGLEDGREVQLDFPGGRLSVDVKVDGGRVSDIFLTGPTNTIAEGTVEDEEMDI